MSEWAETSRPTRHIIGHFRDNFYSPDDPTNNVKALKKASWQCGQSLCSARHMTGLQTAVCYKCVKLAVKLRQSLWSRTSPQPPFGRGTRLGVYGKLATEICSGNKLDFSLSISASIFLTVDSTASHVLPFLECMPPLQCTQHFITISTLHQMGSIAINNLGVSPVINSI